MRTASSQPASTDRSVTTEATSTSSEPQKDSTAFTHASPEARRLAAAILEVLAGVQAPSEAAKGLGISLARYYQLEMRAVAGLVIACEDRRRRRGRGPSAGNDMISLRRECEQLRRECARQQALARATRRTVGLGPEPSPPPAPVPEGKARRRKRRPKARALKMATLLQEKDAAATPSPPTSSGPAISGENAGGGSPVPSLISS
jgi:hypothetical protein